MTIRVAIAGASHWHTEIYVRALSAVADAALVGAWDPIGKRAEQVGTTAGCPSFSDLDSLFAMAKPDLVVALGRHVDLPDLVSTLVEYSVPLIVEKPGAVTAAGVKRARLKAERTRLFVAVPFIHRLGPVTHVIRRMGTTPEHGSFRSLTGPPSRYIASGNEWMLDPAVAGGGCTINLSIHFVDLFLTLCELVWSDVEVVAASMSNACFGLEVEDYSVLALRGVGRTCTVETGYLFRPTERWPTDFSFSVRSPGAYVVGRSPSDDGVRSGGDVTVVPVATDELYRAFVADTLVRLENGHDPVAGLADLEAAMHIIDRAYQVARQMPGQPQLRSGV